MRPALKASRRIERCKARAAKPRPERVRSHRLFNLDWIDTFLPHYRTCEPSKLHRELAGELTDFHAHRGSKRCYIAPRGAAKTTYLSKAYPLYCAVEGIEPLTLLLAETGQQAETYLAAIKKELEGNPKLAEAYSGVVGEGPSWRGDRITLRNGCTIVARGAGGRILGLTEGATRPTLVVGDDMNQRADAYSPTLRSRKLDWFLKDVANVGSPATNFLAAGTPIHMDAVVCELKRNGGWVTKSFRSIIRWPDRMDLWETWERLVSNDADPERAERARAFFLDREEEMMRGSEVLWPERESLYDLMVKRAEIGDRSFASEKQDEPGTDGACSWPAEYFDHTTSHPFWFESWPETLVRRQQTLDPSKGAGESADYQAHIMIGLAPDGVLYFDADFQREPPSSMIQRGIRLARQFATQEWWIEDNGTMGLLVPELQRQTATAGWLVPWAVGTSKGSKTERILEADRYLSRNRVRVRNSAGGRKLVEQWRQVPNGEHDDGPDAASMGLKRLEEWNATR